MNAGHRGPGGVRRWRFLPPPVVLATLAVVALPALHPPAARAAFPGKAGKLVFMRALNILVMDPHGGGVTQLTGGSDVDQQPAWSPDSTRIAFARQAGTGHPHIYVMSASGKGILQLTGAKADDVDPGWSPDGSRIAFVRGVGATRLRIVVMRADGTGQRRIAMGHGPAWSPDGRWLAFSRFVNGRGAIFLVRPDGSSLHRLTPARIWADSPSWSPAGRSLAFTIVNKVLESSDIGVIGRDGHGLRRVTHDHPGQDQDPAWSPGGGRIAFVRVTESGGQMVERLHVLGAGQSDTGSAPGPGTRGTEPDWQPLCTIRGTAGGDVLRGTGGRDLICPGAGADTVLGGGGNDVSFGGPGNDVVRGGSGRDVLIGGRGHDHLYGDAGADLVNARDGTGGNDHVDGGGGNDVCPRDHGDVTAMCP
ncbi:MAG: hypothetical protein ACJ77A_13805 [Actinomycetota bacterium]